MAVGIGFRLNCCRGMLLRGAGDTLEADVVIGPIADDTIFDTFGITSSGTLKPNDALALLRIGRSTPGWPSRRRRLCCS